MYIFVISLIILLTVIESGAMYNLKQFNITGSSKYYLFGALGYAITSAIFSYSLGYEKIGIVNHSWNVMSSLFGFLIGYIYFKEKLATVEIIGVIISMVGLILMGYSEYI